MMIQQTIALLMSVAFSITFTIIVGAGNTTVFAEEGVAAVAVEDIVADDTTAAAVTEEDKNIAYDGSDLIEWINSNGGFIHPNARIGLDPTGNYRGVFVKSAGEEDDTADGIEEDELVCSIPW